MTAGKYLDISRRRCCFDSLRRRDCRKSGLATFSRKLRCVLRLSCPLTADNSTLTPRKVFSATHMSRQKTDHIAFASADAKLCEAFFDMLNPTRYERVGSSRFKYINIIAGRVDAFQYSAVMGV